jgi:Zn-dependent protease with chaperone function
VQTVRCAPIVTSERVTFYEAQASHRRAARRWRLACAAAVLVLATAVSVILTPALTFGLLIGVRGVHAVWPLPPAFWTLVREIIDAGEPSSFIALLAPGTMLVLAVWTRQRAVRGPARAGRPLDHLDLEEHQLSNIVDEMAIAAGIRAPQVFLSPGAAPDAVIAGSDAADATITVTDGALRSLDREQTQGLIGHATASIVNGDLAVELETAAVARTYTQLMTWLAWPLNAGTVRLIALLPFAAVTLVAKLLVILVTLFTLVPLVGWMHRHRRYLADATAVQLTRNPTALARAISASAPIRIDAPLILAGVHPPAAARLARLTRLGAAIAPPVSPPVTWRRPSVSEIAGVSIVLAICSPFLLYLVSVAALVGSGAVIGAYWLVFWMASRVIP